MDNQLILGYWAFRGRAQTIRYLLEYLELPYQEKRYTKMEEWFQGDSKAEPFCNHNLCNLPYLKDGNEYIYETGAILVYLIHKAGRLDLFGKSDEEKIEGMQLRGVIHDVAQEMRVYIKLTEEEKKTKGKEIYQNQIKWLLERINRQIAGRKFLIGDNLHYIDFNLFEVEEAMKFFHPELFAEFENLVKHHSHMIHVPQIKAYFESERFIPNLFIPKMH